MTKYRICLCIMAVFLLIAIFSLSAQQESLASSSLITVEVKTDGRTEKIESWVKADVYYVFLPSYADLSQVQIKQNTEIPVKINDEYVTGILTCEEFQLGVLYELTYNSWKKEYRYSIIFLRSSNIATMYIDTDSGSMDYIHEKKGNEESGRVSVYTAEGRTDYAGELLSMNGRGNNTWENFDKKAYSLELSEESELLGMGEAQRWILLANADDPSHMRNKIVYDFAEKIGLAYSPDSQWVDLYLNDKYAGLYLLCERNELHEERIDISKEGSFVVSLELTDRLIAQNYAYVETNEKQALRIHYPINKQQDGFKWIQDIWQSVENAILAENGIDEVSGKTLGELIDINSWAKKYLIEEIFASGDACFISQFFYLDGGQENAKVYAGPVWDFDHCLGTRVAWALTEPKTMYANRLHVKDGFDRPWFYTLYQDEKFFNQVVSLYAMEYMPVLEQLLNYDIPKYSKTIEQSAELNRIRWDVESEGLIVEQAEIQNFLSDRIVFLNSIWLQDREYHLAKIDQGFGGFYGYYAIYAGDCLQNLPELEDTEYEAFCGWYYSDSNEPFDITKPITEDIEIYAKWEPKPTKKLGQFGKIAPLGIIAVIGVCVLVIDIKRARKNR